MYSKNAFTLVELIVWVTISMLLMTSVWILVSSGMQNILKQQNIMWKNSLLTQTVSEFYSGFNTISTQSGYVFSSNSWAIFKIDQNIQKWGFWYLWATTQSWIYCSSESEIWDMDYLTWKTFIPHEEIWEDIFSDFSTIETQTINSWATVFTVDTLNHQVLENWTVIIWWNVFWHEIKDWESGLQTRLNNPTAITLAEGWFFLSDTLNHRILFYKDWNVNLILDQNDGLQEPTGLAYDNVKNILYISNSWKWEILSFSSEQHSANPELKIKFSPQNNTNSISRMTIKFPNFSGTFNTWSLSDFTFNNINNWTGYTAVNWNQIEYYFTDYNSNSAELITNSYIDNCTPSDTYILNWTTPERHIYTCTDTHTWTYQIHDWNKYQNFNTSTTYSVDIQNISPLISTIGTQWIDLELFSDTNTRYTNSYYYFTQWDWLVSNLKYVKLETLISWLGYPTWLNISWNRLEINDFITRKQYSYDLNNITSFTTNNLNDFTSSNLQNIPYSKDTDILLENPITEININYNNLDKFLSGKIKYYQYLNCYNPDEQVQKSLILQKNID